MAYRTLRRPATGNGLSRRYTKRGAITVLFAIVLVVMLMVAAFALDLGVICVAKTELQRSADAAALAGTEELLQQTIRRREAGDFDPGEGILLAREAAVSFAGQNKVFGQATGLDENEGNSDSGEVVVGEMPLFDPNPINLSFSDPSRYNSIRVTARRTAERNGEIGLFFGRVAGLASSGLEATSQAAFLQDFRGFRLPEYGDPAPALMVLPFAVHRDAWNDARAGLGADNYKWDPDLRTIQSGPDGLHEIELYPLNTGAGGNFGTVDIGSNNSTTPVLRRQITHGLTRADLDFHGGSLELNEQGELHLSGDPGLKLGALQPELRKILGQVRMIPLYRSVSGSGNGADYTIVGFAGIRVLDVQLTGSKRFLRVQSAALVTRGGVPGPGSFDIYSPVKLVD